MASASASSAWRPPARFPSSRPREGWCAMNVNQAAPDVGGIVTTIVVVVVVLVFGWLLLAWTLLKRPLLAVPVAAFAGLVVLVGAHDAQALVIYAVVGLGLWRVVHRSSFERLVGRRLRSSWRRWWVYGRRWRSTMAMSGLTK